jgi:hypothetical protein
MTKPDCAACREKDVEIAQLKARLEAVIKLVSVGSPEGTHAPSVCDVGGCTQCDPARFSGGAL